MAPENEDILVVDDNPANLKLVSFLLEAHGFSVTVAATPDEALAAIAERVPALILMDLQLPGMDGFTLTQRLRADPRTQDVFIVALTAYAMKGDEEKALAAGCNAYVTKPIDTRTLPEQIRGYLRARAPEPSSLTPETQRAASESDGHAAPGRTNGARADEPRESHLWESQPRENGHHESEPREPEPQGHEARAHESPESGSRENGVREEAPPTILLVDDNPITRKLVRYALEQERFRVVEAPDGATALTAFPVHRPALVLQDLCLPDIDGVALLARLRELPGGVDVPILAFSGMLSHEDSRRLSAAGFDDLISKPVEPSRLVQIVRSHLPLPDPNDAPLNFAARELRLVVADDDPVQRKLIGYRLQRLGFTVELSANGEEALEAARRDPPDAVVSDVLMPGLDGFALCRTLKTDPRLAHVPIVLTTNSYVEPTDRDLAKKAGAYDLVLRTPELREVLTALREGLSDANTPPPPPTPPGEFEAEHMQRMMRQLERQVALNAGANQRNVLLAAEMAVLKGISQALAGNEDIDSALRHALAASFDAGGISLGALYLREGEGFRVLSFGYSKDWSDAELSSFFGEPELLRRILETQQSTLLLARGEEPAAQRVLQRASVDSALIVPLGYREASYGALAMLSREGELDNDDRVRFVEAVAGQISQALAMANAFQAKVASERAARAQTAILRSVLESIGDGVGVVDEHGKFILWNSAAGSLVTMTSTEDFKRNDESFGIFEADQVTPMPFDRLPLIRAMRGESVHNAEMFVRHVDAPKGAWFSATSRPWRDEESTVRGGVVVFRDITQEKATQAQLMVSDRMASVGMLAAGVAHEINNPLACVLANLELSEQLLTEALETGSTQGLEELREMLRDARTAADRVRQIVRDLKIFSRHEEPQRSAVDIQKVLESTVRMAWNEIRHRAQLVRDYGDVPAVEGSDSRLGQVFLNLIVNAAQAIPEGNASGNVIKIFTRRGDDGSVIVGVSDTGRGISPESQRHLFRPFFTTKAPGVGTGLGLAICQRIVTDLGGSIDVQSKVGQGTTFFVKLRAASAEVASERRPKAAGAPAARRGHILIVDDEPMIAAVIARVLAREHDVVTVSRALDALEKIRSGETFDLILCDLMMPQMTGMDLYQELRRMGSACAERMIFMTGGAFTPAARAFLDEVPNDRFEKPFDALQLGALVNQRLDRTARAAGA